jgi:hypothetical protein
VESSCKLGNEPSGSIKCWEPPSGCTTCGLSSGTQLHRVSWLGFEEFTTAKSYLLENDASYYVIPDSMPALLTFKAHVALHRQEGTTLHFPFVSFVAVSLLPATQLSLRSRAEEHGSRVSIPRPGPDSLPNY